MTVRDLEKLLAACPDKSADVVVATLSDPPDSTVLEIRKLDFQGKLYEQPVGHCVACPGTKRVVLTRLV